MPLGLNYPARADTTEKKLAFATRMEEHIRWTHNIGGLWSTAGLTRDEYDNGVDGAKIGAIGGTKYLMTSDTKGRRPFKAQLTRDEWKAFQEREWDQRHTLVLVDTSQLHQTLLADTDYDSDIDLDNQ